MAGARLTRSEGRAYRKRWARANAAELVELRATSPERKLRQLASLMASVGPMGWAEPLQAEVPAVRERWARLRRTYAV